MDKKRINRKLIRPNFTEYKEKMSREASKQKKTSPPAETHAENYYYLKQMNKKTLIEVVLLDGETVTGIIEWYDRHCIKVNRDDAPNLLIYKHSIKYLQKIEDKKESKTNKPKKTTKETKKTTPKKKA
jgi:RNA chaperone Hfq